MENTEDRWPMDLESIVGRRVRELREAKGLTQQQLGQELFTHGPPMHQATVAKLEAGLRPLRLNEIALLAAFFDVPIDALWLSDDRDVELEGALAKVHEMLAAEVAARRADEAAKERVREARERLEAAELAAARARDELEDVWISQTAAMTRYEELLKTRKARRHG